MRWYSNACPISPCEIAGPNIRAFTPGLLRAMQPWPLFDGPRQYGSRVFARDDTEECGTKNLLVAIIVSCPVRERAAEVPWRLGESRGRADAGGELRRQAGTVGRQHGGDRRRGGSRSGIF